MAERTPMTIHPKVKEKAKDYASNVYLAMEWRIIATLLTFLSAYIVSGNIIVSTKIASVEVLIKIIAHAIWLKHRVRKHKKDIHGVK